MLYNAQAVVDADGSQLILHTDVITAPSDQPSFARVILSMELAQYGTGSVWNWLSMELDQGGVGLPKTVLGSVYPAFLNQ